MQLPIIPIILSVIVIGLGIFIFLPAFAQTVQESDGSHTSLQNAINIANPEVSQVYYETLQYNQRHFYTFDAAQGETIHFELNIPLLDGLENYMPTIAFSKLGDTQKEFIRYSLPMFFGEIEGARSIQNNFYQNQDETRIIEETGTYVIEIFEEGNCLVRLSSTIEKRCDILPDNPFEFFDVFQGKYAFEIGTIDESQIPDKTNSWIQTRIFLEEPIGNLIHSLTIVQTGDSPENLGSDDLRWIIILSLLLISVIIILFYS